MTCFLNPLPLSSFSTEARLLATNEAVPCFLSLVFHL